MSQQVSNMKISVPLDVKQCSRYKFTDVSDELISSFRVEVQAKQPGRNNLLADYFLLVAWISLRL
jgi:hypothetical protein